MDYVTTAQIQQPIQHSCPGGLGMDAVNLSGDRLQHSCAVRHLGNFSK